MFLPVLSMDGFGYCCLGNVSKRISLKGKSILFICGLIMMSMLLERRKMDIFSLWFRKFIIACFLPVDLDIVVKAAYTREFRAMVSKDGLCMPCGWCPCFWNGENCIFSHCDISYLLLHISYRYRSYKCNREGTNELIGEHSCKNKSLKIVDECCI